MLVYPKIVTTEKVGSQSSDFHLLIVAGRYGPAMLVYEKFGLELTTIIRHNSLDQQILGLFTIGDGEQ